MAFRWQLGGWRGALLSLVGFNLLFFRHQYFTQAILHGSGTDIVSYQYPVLDFVRSELLAGRFPFVLPHVFGGQALHAVGQAGITYPPNWLFMLPGTFAWIKLSVGLHVLLSSVLAYFLADRLMRVPVPAPGPRAAGAVVAGLVYGYGGFFLLHAYAGHINLLAAASWMPGLWLALMKAAVPAQVGGGNRLAGAQANVAPSSALGPGHRSLDCARDGPSTIEADTGRQVSAAGWTGGLGAASLAGVVLGLMILCGTPQVVLLGGLVGGFWFLVPWLASVRAAAPGERRRVLWTGLLRCGVVAVVGVGLSAVQLLPMLELAGESARAASEGSQSMAYSLPLSGLWNVVFPWFWGHAAEGWWVALSRWEFAAYVGLGPLLLAVVAARDLRRGGLVLAGAVLCLLAALGDNGFLYARMLKALPLLSDFRVPARFLLPATLLLAVGAGLGAGIVASTAARLKRVALVAAVPVAAAWWLAVRLKFGSMPEFLARYVDSMEGRKEIAAEWLGAGFLLEAAIGTVIVLWIVAQDSGRSGSKNEGRAGRDGAALPQQTQWGAWPGRIGTVLPVAAVAVALSMAGSGLLSGGSPGLYRVSDDAGRFLARVPQGERVLHFEQRGWNRLYRFGLENIGGYEPALSARMNRFANVATFGERGVDAKKQWALWPTDASAKPSPALSFAGVGYAVVRRDLPFLQGGWVEVPGAAGKAADGRSVPAEEQASFVGGSYRLVHNPQAAPMAFCPERVLKVQTMEQAARFIAGGRKDARRVAVVETGGLGGNGDGVSQKPAGQESLPGGEASGACQLGLVGEAPGIVGYRVDADAPAMLVVAQQAGPGWQCEVDGRREPAMPANLVSAACRVPAGHHEVLLRLVPVTFFVGEALSLSTAALLLLTWGGLRYVNRRRRHA